MLIDLKFMSDIVERTSILKNKLLDDRDTLMEVNQGGLRYQENVDLVLAKRIEFETKVKRVDEGVGETMKMYNRLIMKGYKIYKAVVKRMSNYAIEDILKWQEKREGINSCPETLIDVVVLAYIVGVSVVSLTMSPDKSFIKADTCPYEKSDNSYPGCGGQAAWQRATLVL
jgi:hypothetical protein